ncbi:MAG TPA: YceI family protein [Acidimicrobiales bacterium]|nr:YceI family protein [Acidimicrobiales bacterium]
MTATRSLDGVDLPASGVWEIDPSHAEVAFIGRHFMLTKVRGRFTGVSGAIALADDLTESALEVEIDTGSVSSGDQTRDDHLRSADFFDVENHPRATFRSTSVTRTGNAGTVTGDLTIKGVTRPITLQVEYLGHVQDPWGGHRAVFSARGTLNREDWGLTWNMVLDNGGLVVSKEIRLEIEVEAVRRPQ